MFRRIKPNFTTWFVRDSLWFVAFVALVAVVSEMARPKKSPAAAACHLGRSAAAYSFSVFMLLGVPAAAARPQARPRVALRGASVDVHAAAATPSKAKVKSASVDVHMREKGPTHLIEKQREYLSTLTITAALIAGVAMTAAHAGPQNSPQCE